MKGTKFLTILSLIAAVTLSTHTVYCENFIPYNEVTNYMNISSETIPVTIKFPDTSVKTENIIYCNGRLYLPLEETAQNMGAAVEKNPQYIKFTHNGKNIWISPSDLKSITTKDGKDYISIYTFTQQLNLTPVFDINSNSVTLYKRNTTMPDVSPSYSTFPAYIRFEDIMADGLDSDNPNYTTEALEKLTYMADYMYARGQKFYIAWIPLYVNPTTGCTNNVSLNYNLYNACFVYTLDYLTEHGGTIVLHGYTHQYNSDKSAVGYEWGENTPYSDSEQQQRMINAKTIAARLGFNNDIFEFPHYGATTRQLRMAENYFKVIYQAYPSENAKNIVAYTQNGGGTFYIPTPADYIYNAYNTDGIIARLQNCIANGYAVSLFYHPTLDIKERSFLNISTDEKNMVRNWYLSDQSALAKVVTFVTSSGYSFSSLNY